MDEEHKPLFTCVAEIETHPNDAELVKSCLEAYVEHFNHEQSLFTDSNLYPDEEAYQHINKHNAFLATMRGLTTPVAQTWITFAKNWLTQHIKNTDHQYTDRLIGADTGAIFSGVWSIWNILKHDKAIKTYSQ